jgi:hypothetical protein
MFSFGLLFTQSAKLLRDVTEHALVVAVPSPTETEAMSELTVFGGFAHRWGAICVGDERTDDIRRFRSSLGRDLCGR